MDKAEDILFEDIYDKMPLFRGQLELVHQLINHPESHYYVENKESIEYKKQTNRLKTYISQLLSGEVYRKITPVFKRSLELVLKERLEGTNYNYVHVKKKIIASLEKKNIGQSYYKTFSSLNYIIKKELYNDVINANHILVIAARPFDMNTDSKDSMLRILFLDLLNSFTFPDRKLKYYRFNFPLKDICELFWYSLRRTLETSLTYLIRSKDIIKSFYLKSFISEKTYNEIIDSKDSPPELLNKVACEIMLFLNKNHYILIFHNDYPIYTVPLIITNPNESKNCNGYIILESEAGEKIDKLSFHDIITWKYFVYDKMKTKGLGLPIDFIPSFSIEHDHFNLVNKKLS